MSHHIFLGSFRPAFNLAYQVFPDVNSCDACDVFHITLELHDRNITSSQLGYRNPFHERYLHHSAQDDCYGVEDDLAHRPSHSVRAYFLTSQLGSSASCKDICKNQNSKSDNSSRYWRKKENQVRHSQLHYCSNFKCFHNPSPIVILLLHSSSVNTASKSSMVNGSSGTKSPACPS